MSATHPAGATMQNVLSRLEGVKRHGDKYMARCPAHADRTPSLSIREGDDGRVLVKCFAGCETADVVKEMGLEMGDLFADTAAPTLPSRPRSAAPPTTPQTPTNPRSFGARLAEVRRLRLVEPQAFHEECRDADAEWEAEEWATVVKAPKKAGFTTYLYDTHQVVRNDYYDARAGEWKKPHIPRYPNPDGTWTENKLPDNPARIYGRAELAQRPNDPIYLVEGEKCVEAVRAVGLTAITWLGGAKAAARAHDQLIAACRGRNVVLLPDEDETGRTAMAGIAAALAGHAASIKVVDLYPGTEHKRDIVDWLHTGGTAEELELKRYVAEAPEYEMPAEEPAAAPRIFATYTPGQMKERPAITFAVENLIPTGGFASLVGAPATYKSFIALDIAASIAAQGFWHGRDAAQGGVLYISAEGASGIGQRIRAWETARRRDIPDTFRIITDAPQLREGEDVAALIATAAGVQAKIDVPLRLIVIDTFARTFSGEENSSKEVGEAIAAADLVRRMTGAAVLLVHHLNKAGTASRGSSALLGALDVEITATRNDHTVTLEVTKAKDFGEGEPIMLAAHVVDLEGGGSSLVLDAEMPSIDALPAAAKNVALVLDDQFGELGAAQSVWKKACEEKSFSSETFNRSRRQLVDKGYVTSPLESTKRGHPYRLTRAFYEQYKMEIPSWLDTQPAGNGAQTLTDGPSQSVPSELLADSSQSRVEDGGSIPLSTTAPWYQQSAGIATDSGRNDGRYQKVPNEYHGTNASPEEVSTIGTTTHRVGTVVPTSEERHGKTEERGKSRSAAPAEDSEDADHRLTTDADRDDYFGATAGD